MPSEQEIFDKVVNHLMAQQEQAFCNVEKTCMYRKEVDGKVLKCAVGCLIPDNEYSAEIEYIDPEDVLKIRPDLQKFIGGNLNLLSELQDCHDNYEVEEWEDQLRNIALGNNLNLPQCLK